MQRAIKILTLLLLSALSFLPSVAQSMAETWSNMPAHIMPTIGKNARLDMIDLYNAGMSAKIPTYAGDTAQLVTLGDTYLNLRTSKASTVQIKEIKSGKKILYAIVTTVEGPVPNSHVDLYDNHWQPLEIDKYFIPVTVTDFINLPKKQRKERNELVQKITLRTIQYTMSDDSDNIIAHPSFLQTLDDDTRKEIEDNFHKQITLQWKGKKWKL